MIALGSDHAGFPLKSFIIEYLENNNISYKDFGTHSNDSVDYADYAKKVCQSILSGESEKGILICGTGIGISITANRFKGIRAALCHNEYTAKLTREHNDANILALGERVIGYGLAIDIVEKFLKTPFSNDERHIKRLSKIDENN